MDLLTKNLFLNKLNHDQVYAEKDGKSSIVFIEWMFIDMYLKYLNEYSKMFPIMETINTNVKL